MDVTSLTDTLSQLQLAEKAAFSLKKTEPDFVLCMDAQQCSVCGKDARLAATSSDYSVRLYSRQHLAYTGNTIVHEEGVTGVKFAKTNHNTLYTSSRDGCIRCWDMRTKLTSPSQVFEGYAETRNVFISFDLACNDNILCAGTEAEKDECHLIFWDCRKAEPLGVYSDSHQDDITQVCFHPQKADSLITGSTDGLLCLFDISEETEDDALQTVFNTESSVNQIGWCGPELQNIYCITHIETLHVWDSLEFEDISNFGDVRNRFEGKQQIEYMVDCFQPERSQSPLLLAGTHSGGLHLIKMDENSLDHLTPLDCGHTDTVRCVSWDSETESLVTGGEDSMLCLWKAGSHQVHTSTPSKHKAKSGSRVKARIKKSVSARVKPF